MKINFTFTNDWQFSQKEIDIDVIIFRIALEFDGFFSFEFAILGLGFYFSVMTKKYLEDIESELQKFKKQIEKNV